MATFKNTYTTPETQANVTYDKLISYEVNANTGRCTGRFEKYDGSDNLIGRRTEEVTLTSTDLSTPTDTIFDAFQTAGKTPAGTIAES